MKKRIRAAMVFPTRESERAISGYSSTLMDIIKKQGVDINGFNYSAGKPLTLFKNLSKLSRYDLIHLQHEYNLLGKYGLPFFWVFLYLGIFKKNKLVVTMHTVLSLKEKFREKKTKTFFRKLLYMAQNGIIGLFSDMIVVHTNFLKETLSREYGVNKSKIVVFPQGILEGLPKYSKQKIRKELRLSGNVYLLMGSMIPDHGHDIIIRQADKIGKTILVVANPGSVNDRNSQRTRAYLENNKKIVKENHFEKFVRFDVSEKITDKNPVWWKYFAAADLVLLPYRVGHGSGIFAHSMAANKPVIGSNVKFFNEISKDYGCVKIAEKDSEYPKIIKQSMKPKNYKKIVEECGRYFKENRLSVVAKKYKKLYLYLNNKN